MARIIQDSDDEFDEEDLEEKDAEPAQAPPVEDASSKQLDHTSQHGTGSTESLRRRIEEAHRAHFQSDSDQPTLDVPTQQDASKSPLSNSGSGSNQKHPSAEDILLTSSNSSLKNVGRPLKTYGKSKSILSSPMLPHTMQEDVGARNSGWELEGTIRDEYAMHEPMAMFPEQSSTVPYATLTQQQLLAEVTDPAFLGIETAQASDVPREELAKSSVPWSDFIKSPSEAADAHATPVTGSAQGVPELARAQQEENASNSEGSEPQEAPAAMSQAARLSQRSRRESSVHLRGSPLRNIVLCEELGAPATPTHNKDTVEQVSGRPTPSPLTPEAATRAKDEKGASQNSPIDLEADSKSIDPAPGSAVRSKKRKVEQTVDVDEDLEAIGLPKEQYKPRPSRSRSLRTEADGAVDYSVRPEKAAKKAKRSKTLEIANVSSRSTTPEKVQQICDMGFTPSTTQRALRKNNGDVGRTVDWLVTDELAPTQSRPSRRTKKIQESQLKPDPLAENEEMSVKEAKPFRESTVANSVAKDASDASVTDEQAALNNTTELPAQTAPASLNSSREATSANAELNGGSTEGVMSPETIRAVPTSSKKPKRRKTTLDQPEPSADAQSLATDAAKAKKRGRGRPRKEVFAAPVVAAVLEEEDTRHDNTEIQQVAAEPVLQETQPKVLPDENVEEQVDVTNSVTEPHATTPSTSIQSDPLKSPKPPGKQTGSATPTSALGKGKTPYRVGLSKRARIAPLLRVMKK